MDFLCGYSVNNMGHSHPRLVAAAIEQVKKITQTSRAFHNDKMGATAEYLCETFGYDKMLPMNTGVEACETVCKIARRWGYQKKGIAPDQAKIVMANGNFWGRTITASGASDDPMRFRNFGPFTPGFPLIDYDDIGAVRKLFKEEGKNICAIFMEPIQGEKGVIIPDSKFFPEVAKLCKEHKILLCIDEVQTGIGRTGQLFGHQWDGIKPDMISVGKAISGGVLPVSAAFGSNELMSLIGPGEHGSTFGGNPLGMVVAKTAIEILMDERLIENSQKMGELMSYELNQIKSGLIKQERGRGLFRVLEIQKDARVNANDMCDILLPRGLLTRAAKDYNVRLAPALVISEKEVLKSVKIIKKGIKALEKLNKERK